MSATHLVVAACLLAWSSLAASVPANIEDRKENYTVCQTDVCKQRADLINKSLDPGVDPCGDFYSYACGGWKKNHQIPADKQMIANTVLLRDEVKATLKGILEKMALVYRAQNITDKAAVAYNACMAVPASEDRRDVMMQILDTYGLVQWPITNTSTGEKFGNCSDVLNKTGYFPILSLYVGRDLKNLNSNIIALDQILFKPVGRNQLIHPDTQKNKNITDAYKELIQATLKFMKPNISDLELMKISSAIVNFEGQLANLTAPPEERRDVLKIYNRTTIEELEMNFTSIPLFNLLTKEFSEANITVSVNETVELYGLKYYTGLNSFLEKADPNTLYNYAGVKVMLRFGTEVSERIRNASFELTKAISGVQADTARWEKCVDSVNDMMPQIVGLLYVQHNFSKEAKQEAEDLVKRLTVVFHETLLSSTWMDNTTREAAEHKLMKMGAKIGYPDWLYNSTYLEELYRFVPELCINCSFAQMLVWNRKNGWMLEMLRLREPYNSSAQWSRGPAVVNAYYKPSTNEMGFPSGILQGVLYQHGLPRSINFGAIGMVVGHEMTHGFDNKGSQYDADGGLEQWWTNETRSRFDEKASCFEYQYGNITDPVANMSLNGKLTLGENIADNGGLRTAFGAYNKLLDEECDNTDTRLPGLEYLSGKKLFFIANAMVWCSNSREKYLRQRIQYDKHSPSKYRTNVPMANFEAFTSTFNCPANSSMNPKHRCILW